MRFKIGVEFKTDYISDRFARLSSYNTQIPSAPDLKTAVSLAAGMIRAVSAPIVPESYYKGQSEATAVWPTFWRMYHDTLDMVSFYESALSPSIFWIEFDGFNLGPGGPLQVLSLIDQPWYTRVGNLTDAFTNATLLL